MATDPADFAGSGCSAAGMVAWVQIGAAVAVVRSAAVADGERQLVAEVRHAHTRLAYCAPLRADTPALRPARIRRSCCALRRAGRRRTESPGTGRCHCGIVPAGTALTEPALTGPQCNRPRGCALRPADMRWGDWHASAARFAEFARCAGPPSDIAGHSISANEPIVATRAVRHLRIAGGAGRNELNLCRTMSAVARVNGLRTTDARCRHIRGCAT